MAEDPSRDIRKSGQFGTEKTGGTKDGKRMEYKILTLSIRRIQLPSSYSLTTIQ